MLEIGEILDLIICNIGLVRVREGVWEAPTINQSNRGSREEYEVSVFFGGFSHIRMIGYFIFG